MSSPINNPIQTFETTKEQPWLSIWPNQAAPTSDPVYYGYKKGEVLALAGNAGDFFARGNWKVEHDTANIEKKCERPSFGDSANSCY